MQPVIGITTGEIESQSDNWSPITYGQSHTYSDAIIRAGGVPFLIPITDQVKVLRQLYQLCDGLLLAGGNDISPTLYGEVAGPKTTDVSERRDAVDMQLLTWALADQKPLLGICRGMQLLNAHYGGSLYQDISSELPNATDHHISSAKQDGEHIAHTLRVKPGSRLARIIASTTIGANSHHHQAIKKLGNRLHATAWSEDGIIEALEVPDIPYALGVQCHPESLQNVEPKWNTVFAALVNEAK